MNFGKKLLVGSAMVSMLALACERDLPNSPGKTQQIPLDAVVLNLQNQYASTYPSRQFNVITTNQNQDTVLYQSTSYEVVQQDNTTWDADTTYEEAVGHTIMVITYTLIGEPSWEDVRIPTQHETEILNLNKYLENIQNNKMIFGDENWHRVYTPPTNYGENQALLLSTTPQQIERNAHSTNCLLLYNNQKQHLQIAEDVDPTKNAEQTLKHMLQSDKNASMSIVTHDPFGNPIVFSNIRSIEYVTQEAMNEQQKKIINHFEYWL